MQPSDYEAHVEAKRARDRGDLARAIEIYEGLAKDGDVYSLVMLGSIYARGIGTAVDLEKAEKLFDRAAAFGTPEAHFQMANVWYDRGDMNRYFLAIQQASRMDLLVAQFYLGRCYAYGLGVDKDDAKALELMRNAAERGHVRAKMYLARRQLFKLYNPIGVVYGLIKFLSAAIEGLVISMVNPHDERVR
jgi:TPR repeat protein